MIDPDDRVVETITTEAGKLIDVHETDVCRAIAYHGVCRSCGWMAKRVDEHVDAARTAKQHVCIDKKSRE